MQPWRDFFRAGVNNFNAVQEDADFSAEVRRGRKNIVFSAEMQSIKGAGMLSGGDRIFLWKRVKIFLASTRLVVEIIL